VGVRLPGVIEASRKIHEDFSNTLPEGLEIKSLQVDNTYKNSGNKMLCPKNQI